MPECEVCGRLFDTERGLGSHVGHAHPGHRTQTEECANCHEEVIRPLSEITGKKNVFCSQDCFDEYRRKTDEYSGENNPRWSHVTKDCAQCGEPFLIKPARLDVGRFCGQECYGEWRSENIVGESHPQFEGGQFPYGTGFTEKRKEQVRKRDNYRCQSCGRTNEENVEKWGERLTVHHIIKARRYEGRTEGNEMENLVSLCKSCHPDWEQIPGLRPELVASEKTTSD